MPFIYVKAQANIKVTLPEPGFMDEWDSPEALAICVEYGHPQSTINFKIDVPEKPLQPMLIMVGDTEAYAGSSLVTKIDDKTYMFEINGLFKSSVHKDTVKAIKEGMVPKLEGVTRYRQGYDFSGANLESLDHGTWQFSAKKI
jgi:hypothetical protein|tara:strand:- start:578 stop:1006 length:429 start_codon:yes stop_codon:yes gene_type:complete